MLNGEQIEALRQVLAMGGWNDVMKPVLANRAHLAVKALVLDPAEREGEFKGVDDAVLRARIQEAEWMLTAWSNEVSVHDYNRRRDELDRQNQGNGVGAPESRLPANP